MASDDAIQLLLLVILIVISAVLSCAATSLTAVSRLRLQTLAEENTPRAPAALKITENASKMTRMVLICRCLANCFAVFLGVTLALRHADAGYACAVTGILALVILIFCEITPKAIAQANAEKLALAFAPALQLLTRLLTPVIFLISRAAGLILRLFHVDPDASGNTMTELELRTLVDVSHKEGVIEKSEREMIYNVVDFGDSQARDVMVPRADMVTVGADAAYQEIMDVFRSEKYTRLPVHQEDKDNIIGILNIKDFFFVENTPDFQVTQVMYKPYFTYEFKKTSELLMEMQKQSVSVSIVLDEYGSAVGMVSIEDLLEEIVGEIRDEYDEDEKDQIQSVSKLEYLIEGSVKLDDINDAIGLSFSSEDYDSIGGLIIEQLDHLPLEGETVTTETGISLTVEKMDKTRIELVRMILPQVPVREDAAPEKEDAV